MGPPPKRLAGELPTATRKRTQSSTRTAPGAGQTDTKRISILLGPDVGMGMQRQDSELSISSVASSFGSEDGNSSLLLSRPHAPRHNSVTRPSPDVLACARSSIHESFANEGAIGWLDADDFEDVFGIESI